MGQNIFQRIHKHHQTSSKYTKDYPRLVMVDSPTWQTLWKLLRQLCRPNSRRATFHLTGDSDGSNNGSKTINGWLKTFKNQQTYG